MDSNINSFFDQNEIRRASTKALDLYLRYRQSDLEPQSLLQDQGSINLRDLERKVFSNHKKKMSIPIFKHHPQLQVFLPKRKEKQINKENEEEQKKLKMERECKRLYYQEKLSQVKVQKRLGISYYSLREYLEKPIKRQIVKQVNFSFYQKFKKLHHRGRDHIVNLLMNCQHPLQVSDIVRSLKQNIQLNCNYQMIRRFLKEELMMSYKIIKPITPLHNNQSSKLQRQYAAKHIIDLMSSGKRLINIDESVLNQTDERRRGWTPHYVKNKVTNSQRLGQMNLIIGVASTGELFYTINRGKTNQYSFLFYLCKLSATLESIDKNWRTNTVFVIDNAPYHRCRSIMDKYHELKLPILFLGPYHYKIAPAELMYSYIKNRDLNPLNTKAQSRGYWEQFIKELGTNISRINQNVVRRCFQHILTAALESISLKDL